MRLINIPMTVGPILASDEAADLCVVWHMETNTLDLYNSSGCFIGPLFAPDRTLPDRPIGYLARLAHIELQDLIQRLEREGEF